MEEKNNRNSKVLIIILSLVCILSSGAGGYFAYKYYNKDENNSRENGETINPSSSENNNQNNDNNNQNNDNNNQENNNEKILYLDELCETSPTKCIKIGNSYIYIEDYIIKELNIIYTGDGNSETYEMLEKEIGIYHEDVVAIAGYFTNTSSKFVALTTDNELYYTSNDEKYYYFSDEDKVNDNISWSIYDLKDFKNISLTSLRNTGSTEGGVFYEGKVNIDDKSYYIGFDRGNNKADLVLSDESFDNYMN